MSCQAVGAAHSALVSGPSAAISPKELFSPRTLASLSLSIVLIWSFSDSATSSQQSRPPASTRCPPSLAVHQTLNDPEVSGAVDRAHRRYSGPRTMTGPDAGLDLSAGRIWQRHDPRGPG